MCSSCLLQISTSLLILQAYLLRKEASFFGYLQISRQIKRMNNSRQTKLKSFKFEVSSHCNRCRKESREVDLVTETDKACEDLIFNYLKLNFPDHKFIGEETIAAYGATELTDDPTWIVDPLDGTTNFVHGSPFVCVSIGLTTGKVPTIGVVYNPTIGEVRPLQMTGSCALNLCGIACGRLDLFYELGFGGPWDVAGGAVIVKEAGGVVLDPSGGEFDIMAQRVAASNALLKDAFIEALKESE